MDNADVKLEPRSRFVRSGGGFKSVRKKESIDQTVLRIYCIIISYA